MTATQETAVYQFKTVLPSLNKGDLISGDVASKFEATSPLIKSPLFNEGNLMADTLVWEDSTTERESIAKHAKHSYG